METIEPIIKLTEYGVYGVMVGLIILAGGAVYLLYKFASNHSDHFTKAFNKNTKALTQLTGAIKDQKKMMMNLINR